MTEKITDRCREKCCTPPRHTDTGRRSHLRRCRGSIHRSFGIRYLTPRTRCNRGNRETLESRPSIARDLPSTALPPSAELARCCSERHTLSNVYRQHSTSSRSVLAYGVATSEEYASDCLPPTLHIFTLGPGSRCCDVRGIRERLSTANTPHLHARSWLTVLRHQRNTRATVYRQHSTSSRSVLAYGVATSEEYASDCLPPTLHIFKLGPGLRCCDIRGIRERLSTANTPHLHARFWVTALRRHGTVYGCRDNRGRHGGAGCQGSGYAAPADQSGLGGGGRTGAGRYRAVRYPAMFTPTGQDNVTPTSLHSPRSLINAIKTIAPRRAGPRRPIVRLIREVPGPRPAQGLTSGARTAVGGTMGGPGTTCRSGVPRG
ncbi:hypothetical protein J6590_040746 [Homalodisca vitripennis]|nr:hypothetical protein J6590_040746 [Homalodisca vitripennis]